ncbi:MAG: response regulator transcription factor, partial [Bacteroidota bacterium]
MQKIKILIIEDDEIQADNLSYILEQQGFVVAGIAHSLQQAMRELSSKRIDLAIVDVYLDGEPDGLLAAQFISNTFKERLPIIFLTGTSDRDTFKKARLSNPYSYLLKPYNKVELSYAIELAMEAANQAVSQDSASNPTSTAEGSVFIKKNNIYYKVLFTDIIYVEVEGRYSKVITADNTYHIQSSLKDMEALLPMTDFVRVHRNYIIQRDKIREVHAQDNLIVLK